MQLGLVPVGLAHSQGRRRADQLLLAHWIYLGAVWGAVALLALTAMLRMLGAASILYCWTVWTVLGQASGSYVGPKTWAVLLIGAATTILVTRSIEQRSLSPAAPAKPVLQRLRPRLGLVEDPA